MRKLSHYLLLFLVFMVLGAFPVYAVNETDNFLDEGIDMNLTGDTTIEEPGDDIDEEEPNTSTNRTTTTPADTTSSGTSSSTESARVSSVQTSSNSELGVHGIINVLLVTVGVILIFLAIAILIRMR